MANNTVATEKSLEHLLARELRALDMQSEQDRNAEFQHEVEHLLDQFGFSARDAAQILLGDRPQDDPGQRAGRARASVKVFRNPYTRETLKTRSFNHHTLNEWRKRHGRLTVQTWRVK